MKEEIIKLREEFESEISGVGNLNDLSLLKVKYLGKKSKIQTFSSSMKDLSIDEKKEVGKIINEFKNYLESSFSLYKEKLEKEIKDEIKKLWVNYNPYSSDDIKMLDNMIKNVRKSKDYDLIEVT